MLRYLDNSDDVKVGITELQERVGVLLRFGISIQHVAQQAMDEIGQNILDIFWQGEAGQMGGAAERAKSTWKEDVKT